MSQPIHTAFPKGPLKRGLTNNSTDTTYPSLVPTTTAPVTVDSTTTTANELVIDCAGSETHLMPFGTDADNELFQMRVVLWRRIPHATLPLWVPYRAGEFEVTLSSTLAGVASSPVIATEFFADTITEVGTTWDDNLVTVISPTGDAPALIRINTRGFEKMSVQFDIDAPAAGDAASANVCYAQT